ncbi:hypothetical protein COY25_01105 [Candidatus Uhrbacteria bacterium CG_4_10_14_0_2_um_filter_41_7]|nr:MAG: hypothetical protein COY25_01105 [Candidatus Uhrbacteria bacterium CG_4_10_14_0_2_um_filter_41_7]
MKFMILFALMGGCVMVPNDGTTGTWDTGNDTGAGTDGNGNGAGTDAGAAYICFTGAQRVGGEEVTTDVYLFAITQRELDGGATFYDEGSYALVAQNIPPGTGGMKRCSSAPFTITPNEGVIVNGFCWTGNTVRHCLSEERSLLGDVTLEHLREDGSVQIEHARIVPQSSLPFDDRSADGALTDFTLSGLPAYAFGDPIH